MKQLFKIEKTKRKPASKLEAHLVKRATEWCRGKSSKPLQSLNEFYNALQYEKQLYCADHRSARITSVRITTQNSDYQTISAVQIGPAGGDVSATITA